MDDLISRKWLMECVEEGWIKFDTQEDENRFVHLIRDIVPSALENLPSAQQWIPVTERLPEDVKIGEEYPTVIFCTKDTVYAGFFEHYLGGNWWAAEDYTVDNVIAWMPLPEPYKEDQDE